MTGGAYPFTTGEPNFHEFFYGVASIAGEGANFDGNGQYLRVQPPAAARSWRGRRTPAGDVRRTTSLFGNAIEAPIGTRPALTAEPPPFSTERPLPENPVPDVNGPAAEIGPPSPQDAAVKRAIREHRTDFIAIIGAARARRS